MRSRPQAFCCGPADGTAQIVRSGYPGVRLLARARNAGKAATLNCGLAETRHELVVTVDADSWLHADALRLLVRAKFMANPAGGGAYTIRREAFARIIKAFAEAGIKFAERRVTVNVPPGSSTDEVAAATAAAAAGAEPRKP